jgi:large subunit ribosomal protein L23
MYSVLKKPLVTEKAAAYGEHNTYVFRVDNDASKTQIKIAVEKAFNVKVEAVRTLVSRTRWLKQQAKFGPPKHYKKAYVKLVSGQTIALFEGA